MALSSYAKVESGITEPEESYMRTSTILSVQVSQWLKTTLLVLAVFFLGALCGSYFHLLPETSTGSLSPIPTISRNIHTWQPDPLYMGGEGETDMAWDQIIPSPLSIIVSNPSRWGLQPGAGKDGTIYMTTIAHQLHCLSMIRSTYWGLRLNNTAMNLNDPWNEHVIHCFEYLRRGIMCYGDTTVEHKDVIKLTAFSGWNVEHSCVDFDAILAYHRLHGSIKNDDMPGSIESVRR